MKEVFGIPVDTLLLVLLVCLALSLGALAALGIRNRILLKLAVRSVRRRRGRSALIVVGLTLGTTIIAAALTTGDTMSHTIRATTVATLGATDETIAPKGAADDIPGALGAATGAGWLDESAVTRIESVAAGSGIVDGVTGAIIEQVAVQAPAHGQNEPSVVLFGGDPARMDGFSPIRGSGGDTLSLADLRADEVYLNSKAARELRVEAGDRILIFAGRRPVPSRVRDVVRFDGAGSADASLLVSLDQAQRLFGHVGQVKTILVSNRGGDVSGARLSSDVVALLGPVASSLGLEIQTLKLDALEDADAAGNAFMAFFTTFGTFSIAAGILLIFLIFVMLAAERRSELGIARAIGTRRGHLVEMFTFEGVAYDLAAAFVGALLGALVALGMVTVMASAFAAADADEGLQIEFAVSTRSLVIAFALGMLLTLVVVAVSAWRVSVMNVSTAIRNLPEPPTSRRRRRFVLASITILARPPADAVGDELGHGNPAHARVVARAPRPRAAVAGGRRVGADRLHDLWKRDRRRAHAALEPLGRRVRHARDGLLDLDRRRAHDHRGRRSDPRLQCRPPAGPRHEGLRPHPCAHSGAAHVDGLSAGSSLPNRHDARDVHPRRVHARDRDGVERLVRPCHRASTTSAADSRFAPERPAPRLSTTWRAALRRTRDVDAADFTTVGSQSVLAVEAKQLGAGRPYETYLVRGLDPPFLTHTTFGLGDVARGYGSEPEVWAAVRETPGLAVVDSRSSHAATTGTSACSPTSSCPASTSRRASTRSRSRFSTSRPGTGSA